MRRLLSLKLNLPQGPFPRGRVTEGLPEPGEAFGKPAEASPPPPQPLERSARHKLASGMMQTKPKAPGSEALLIRVQLCDAQQVNWLGFFICKMGSINARLIRLGRLHVKCSEKWHLLALARQPGWATQHHMDLGEAVRFSKISRQ